MITHIRPVMVAVEAAIPCLLHTIDVVVVDTTTPLSELHGGYLISRMVSRGPSTGTDISSAVLFSYD